MSCFLSYNLSITGDCTNGGLGVVKFDITGSAPPYNVSGSTGVYTIPSSGMTYIETGLTSGDYLYVISDSCLPVNQQLYVNVYISSGTCVSFTGMENTSCGFNNGSLTAQTTNFYGNSTFYLYGSGGLIQNVTVNDNEYVFNNLSADTYYVIADDGGGCTGKTETCIIKSSVTLDYGFYVVNDTPCNSLSGVGKLIITGLTGVNPFTYLWSNGSTGSTITGLTTGTYTVTVTDNDGCSITKTGLVGQVNSPSIVTSYVTPPSCFSSDGDVTIVITGGTPPYYLSGSTGFIDVTFNNTYTFTGISSGFFTVNGTDAGLCNFTSTILVTTLSSFVVLQVNTINSNCNNSDGVITISLASGQPPYTYSLSDSSGNTQSYTTPSPTWTFNGLYSDTYTLNVTDNGSVCTYIQNYTITNNPKFVLTGNVTGTTGNLNNGNISLSVSGGSGLYRYEITGLPFIDIGLSSYTFNNLSSGTYLCKVTDLNDSCYEFLNLNVSSSQPLNFTLFPVNTITGNDGEIFTFITTGVPPFTNIWTSNVNGQTTLNVTGLTAGTYTLTVTDSVGSTQTRSVILGQYVRYNTGQTYNICDSTFTQSGVYTKGPKQMLIEGFYDLTSGCTNCILNESVFTIVTTLSGITKTLPFYTGNTLNDYPPDTLWVSGVTSLLKTYGNVGEVIADIIENKIDIISDCDITLPLLDSNAIIDFKISYDISCETCPP